MEAGIGILIKKLDEFIRKYYLNRLIHGIIYSVGLLVVFFLLSALIEYFGRLNSAGRAVLFYGYLLAASVVLVKWVFVPLLQLSRLGKLISYDQAAEIIGSHFGNVRDKLINTLQLQKSLRDGSENTALAAASIDQRIKELNPVPFTAAVDLSSNKRFLKFAVIPLSLLLLIWIIWPSFITDSSERIIRYNEAFIPQAPFRFSITNNKLETAAQEDFLMEIKIDGKEIPDKAYIDINGNKFILSKLDKTTFTYTFQNVQETVKFRLYADGFYSAPYELVALPNPVLMNFKVFLDYPRYTGLKNEVLANTGDLSVPAGTKVTWEFNTKNTERLSMVFEDTTIEVKDQGRDLFRHGQRFLEAGKYRVQTENKHLKGKEAIEYRVSVIQDAYPTIEVEEKRDSVLSSRIFFKGNIEDDYGFKKLFFSYRQYNGEKNISSSTQDVPFNRNYVRNTFFWSSDFSQLTLAPGDEIEYWFEVWDNDEVNGSKSARTIKGNFKVPTLDELDQLREQGNEDIKLGLRETLKDAAKIQKDLEELNRRILEKKEIGWQEKKRLEELLSKQNQLQQQIDELKKENQNNNTRNEEFRKSDERILEKQRELEKLFEQILTPEMKEKFRELERMMENIDKNRLKDMIDQMKLENKDIEKELDRSLELFKQLELDQKLNSAIEKLDRLKEEQEKLNKETENKSNDTEKLGQEQEKLNKEFENLRKEIDEMRKTNEELEQPHQMEETDPLEQDIQQEMKESSEGLKQNKAGKASKSQKNASQKMQELSDKLKNMQASMESESMEEDIGKLREILGNLLELSFQQERLMKQLQRTPPSNPLYTTITAEQKKLKDDARMIEDSLFALSKRVAQIQSFVNREISSINMNLEKTVGYLAERQVHSASARQQHAMTSINNLALMLSEITDQMQQQMAQQKQGKGSCSKPGTGKKPGQGKPSMSTIRQLQEQLNDQLQKMKDGMNKPGGAGKQSSEGLARMAAQQEMLRNQIQKLMNEMMKEGDGNSGNLRNIANKMEQTESEIVNKRISTETIKRQQEILTRLLEAENAERERELDDKRESNENLFDHKRNISAFEQYKKLMQQEAELLKTISPQMTPFYKNLVKEYFSTFN